VAISTVAVVVVLLGSSTAVAVECKGGTFEENNLFLTFVEVIAAVDLVPDEEK